MKNKLRIIVGEAGDMLNNDRGDTYHLISPFIRTGFFENNFSKYIKIISFFTQKCPTKRGAKSAYIWGDTYKIISFYKLLKISELKNKLKIICQKSSILVPFNIYYKVIHLHMSIGFLDQYARFIKDDKNISGQEIKKALKQRIQIEKIDQVKYLTDLRDCQDLFNELILAEINTILVSLNSAEAQQELFPVSKLVEIFGITKAAPRAWIRKGVITNYIQKEKGGKIEIPRNEIDNLVNKMPKYKNAWINYNNK